MSADPFLDQPPSTGRRGCAVCAAPTPLAAGDTVCAACLLRDPLRGSVSATQAGAANGAGAGAGAGVGGGPPQFGPLLAHPLFAAPLHHPHQSHHQQQHHQMEAALTATPNEAWDMSAVDAHAWRAGGGRRVADKTECGCTWPRFPRPFPVITCVSNFISNVFSLTLFCGFSILLFWSIM